MNGIGHIKKRISAGTYDNREMYADIKKCVEEIVGEYRAVELMSVISTHITKKLVEAADMAYELALVVKDKMKEEEKRGREHEKSTKIH